MLVAHGGFAVGTAEMRSTFLFERSLHGHVVERSGLVYDSRLAPEVDAGRSVVVVHVAVEGVLEISRPGIDGVEIAQAIVVAESSLEGPRASRGVALRSHGSPFLGIDLRFSRERVALVPPREGTTLAVEPDVAGAVRSMIQPAEGSRAEDGLAVVLAWLERSAVLRPREPSAIPAAAGRLWRAMRPLVEKLAVLPSLDELSSATGLSLRQLARDVDVLSEVIGLGDGWRPLTRRMRLKLAVLALSCEDATVVEVARAVGYSSADAMGRALRDEGLPAPSEVRRVALAGFV